VTTTLALAQLSIEASAYDDNVERALSAIGTAASRGADLVALPELFTVGYFAFDSYARTAEPLDGETVLIFSSIRSYATTMGNTR